MFVFSLVTPSGATTTTYGSLNCSTFTASTSPLISTGVTLSLMLKSLKSRRSPASTPCYWSPSLCWGDRMGNHHLPKIILGSELSAGYHHQGVLKKWFKHCLKKSFRACHIKNCWWSAQAENWNAWCLTTNYDVFFKNTHRVTLKTEKEP